MEICEKGGFQSPRVQPRSTPTRILALRLLADLFTPSAAWLPSSFGKQRRILHGISPRRSGLIIPSNKFIIAHAAAPCDQRQMPADNISPQLGQKKEKKKEKQIFIRAVIVHVYITRRCGHISLAGTPARAGRGEADAANTETALQREPPLSAMDICGLPGG